MLLAFLTIISVPILEVLLLIEVSDRIGAWNTFSLVLASCFLGIWCTRREGREVLFQLRKETARGVLPGESLLHGILVFLGGLLLIIPGFITDVVGFVLLIPYTRNIVAIRLKDWLQKSMAAGKIQVRTYNAGGFTSYRSNYDSAPFADKEIREAKVIDIETKRLERNTLIDPK
jgi:UPF0716 protein FxsA